MADVEKLAQLRPSSLAVLLQFIPFPDSCSRSFLQAVVDKIVQFCSENGLGTDQAANLTATEFKIEKIFEDFDPIDSSDTIEGSECWSSDINNREPSSSGIHISQFSMAPEGEETKNAEELHSLSQPSLGSNWHHSRSEETRSSQQPLANSLKRNSMPASDGWIAKKPAKSIASPYIKNADALSSTHHMWQVMSHQKDAFATSEKPNDNDDSDELIGLYNKYNF